MASDSATRIVHLRASDFYGGPERQLHYHALRAKGSRHEITIASFSEGGRPPGFLREFEKDGIPTHVFHVRSPYDPASLAALERYVRDHGIDILCTHDYRSDILAALTMGRCSTRWVAFSRGFTKINAKVRFYQVIDKFVLRFASHVVAVSESQKRKLTRLWIGSDRISVVRNVIDTAIAETVAPADLRARFGFDRDHCVCVSAGRFSPEKGQDVLIRGAAIALERNPNLRFVLFGDGFELEKGRELVRRLGISEAVVCPGFEPEILQCIAGADVLVNPSYSEGLPNVLLEGMALGTPIVATAVGGVPEILTDGQTGLLVEPGNARRLADAILECAESPEAARRRSIEARAHVERYFSVQSQYEELVRVYDAVAP